MPNQLEPLAIEQMFDVATRAAKKLSDRECYSRRQATARKDASRESPRRLLPKSFAANASIDRLGRTCFLMLGVRIHRRHSLRNFPYHTVAVAPYISVVFVFFCAFFLGSADRGNGSGLAKPNLRARMLFNSPEFVLFCLLVYVLYVGLPFRLQNYMLLVASYIFYGWWDAPLSFW